MSTKNLVIDFCIETASSPASSFSTIDFAASSPVLENVFDLFASCFPVYFSFCSDNLFIDFDLKSVLRYAGLFAFSYLSE